MKRFAIGRMFVVAIVLGAASTAFGETLHPLDPNSQATGKAKTTYDKYSYYDPEFGGSTIYGVVAKTVCSFSGLGANANYRLVGYNRAGDAVAGLSFSTDAQGVAYAEGYSLAGESWRPLRREEYQVTYYLLWVADQDGRPIPGLDPVLSSQ